MSLLRGVLWTCCAVGRVGACGQPLPGSQAGCSGEKAEGSPGRVRTQQPTGLVLA